MKSEASLVESLTFTPPSFFLLAAAPLTVVEVARADSLVVLIASTEPYVLIRVLFRGGIPLYRFSLFSISSVVVTRPVMIGSALLT